MLSDYASNPKLTPSLLASLNGWGIKGLTDVQQKAVAAEVPLGASAVICAPTASGKTLIGELAVVTALEEGLDTLYLVSHKALAEQKFSDFVERFSGLPVPVTDGAILRATVYPDAEDASSNPLTVQDVIDILEGTNTTDPHDFVATTYNADGSVHTPTDQRGIVHTYTFDDLGRLLSDSADITADPAVDDAVLRIERAYDVQGRLATLTSYSDPAGGDANIVNQVGWDYDQWGSVVEIWQAHQDDNGSGTAGWISDGTTPSVQYTYADGTDAQDNQAEFVRLASVVYPDGRVIEYAYGTAGGISGRLSRVESITSSGGTETYAGYSYMGAGTIVGVEYPEVGTSGLTLDYGADGSTGLDRFGRVVSQTWVVDSTEVDDYSYAYDRNSNRTERANGLNSAFSEVYTYDGLNRLIDTNRGGANYQDWTLDAQGNWTTFDDQGTEQDRTTNAANELETVEGQANPTYDAAGNLTFDGHVHLRYDAWNRLTAVYADDVADPGEAGDLIVVYQYDGRGLRVSRSAARYDGLDPHTVTGYDRSDYLYDENRQVLEERFAANVGSAYSVADTPHVQYLPSLGYADSPILRWRNTDGDLETGDDSGMDEVLYYTTDANHNVTTLLDLSGGVVESYAYDAYGRAEVFSPAPSTGDTWGDGSVVTASAVANEITYASYWFDPATGLFHTDTRDYHAALGTWTSRDPAGYIDGMSLYGYVGSNPATLTDPTGLCPPPANQPDVLPPRGPCTVDLPVVAVPHIVKTRSGVLHLNDPAANAREQAALDRWASSQPPLPEGHDGHSEIVIPGVARIKYRGPIDSKALDGLWRYTRPQLGPQGRDVVWFDYVEYVLGKDVVNWLHGYCGGFSGDCFAKCMKDAQAPLVTALAAVTAAASLPAVPESSFRNLGLGILEKAVGPGSLISYASALAIKHGWTDVAAALVKVRDTFKLQRMNAARVLTVVKLVVIYEASAAAVCLIKCPANPR